MATEVQEERIPSKSHGQLAGHESVIKSELPLCQAVPLSAS